MKRSNWIYKLYRTSPYSRSDNITVCDIIDGCIVSIFMYVILALGFVAFLAVVGIMFIGLLDIVLNIFSVGGFMPYFGKFGMLGMILLAGISVMAILIYITETLYNKEWKN